MPQNSCQWTVSHTTRAYYEWSNLAHLTSSLGGEKHKTPSVSSASRDRAKPWAAVIHVESPLRAPNLLHLPPMPLSATGPLLSLSLPPVHRHTNTHTQAGARSSTRRRAHAHCAHCSAAADVWWPKGSEPFQKTVIKIYTIVLYPPEASKSQMDNIWTSSFFFSFSFNMKKADCIF